MTTPMPRATPPIPAPKSFGQTVRDSRIRRGLTQQQLAEELGTTQPTIGRWETGQAFPKPPQLSPLAKALHIPLNELLAPLEYQTFQSQPTTRQEIEAVNERLDKMEDSMAEILEALKNLGNHRRRS